MNRITVSIFMLTYNQERYIAQAIESVLMQKTNFDYQLVIGEDFSADKTRIICEKYAKEYGKKIKLLPSLQINIGLIANYMRTIKECDGTYIAICDGDDYWIDENKLQKQVDFLEQNPEYSIVHTALKLLYPNGDLEVFYNVNNFKYSDFNNLIYFNFIFSVSALFRNIQFTDSLPLWINKYPYGDWPTYLWTIRNNEKIHFLPDITAVYRKNIGVSSRLNNSYSIDLSILKDMYNDVNFTLKKEYLSICIFEKEWHLMLKLNSEKEYRKAFFLFLSLLNQKKDKIFWMKNYLYSLKSSIVKA